MNDLRTLLERASDAIDQPSVAPAAFRAAGRVRARRHRLAACGLVAAATAAVVLAGQFVGGTSDPQPAPAGPMPSGPASRSASAPPAEVQPRFDPRTLNDLPTAPDGVAPALPDVVDPPSTAPLLTDDPVPAAVLALETNGVPLVLGTDGEWRSVPLDSSYPQLSLSPDGTRLAVASWAPEDRRSGVTIYDLATGANRLLPVPDRFQPSEFQSWNFLDENTLILTSRRSYRVDAVSGRSETAPYDDYPSAIDPAGNVLTVTGPGQNAVLTDWAGGTPREVSTERTGRLQTVAVSREAVAGAAESSPGVPSGFGLVVADRATLTPTAFLPVRDAFYANGPLSVLALTNDGTVLGRITAKTGSGGIRVFAWDPRSGAVTLVSTFTESASIVFATGLLSGW